MKTLIETRPKATAAILFLGLAAAAVATAAELRVPVHYPAVQAAVDAAHSNDTIHIAAGSYAGPVLISNESLTLLGSPGTKAGAQYQGDGLSIVGSERGALLGCVFQKLEGHATAEGLWLTSTAPDAPNDRFRVLPCGIGREGRRQRALQRAPALAGPWASSAPQIAPASGRVEFQDTSPAPGQTFYQVVQPLSEGNLATACFVL